MDKKGFTLVEILAVIVIMSVVILIAVPNVMEAMRKAKENTFIDDASNLLQLAKTQYRLDRSDPNVYMSYEMIYCSSKDLLNHTDDCADSIAINKDGRVNLDYFIKLDHKGDIIYAYTTDYTYFFECDSIEDCKKVTSSLYFVEE